MKTLAKIAAICLVGTAALTLNAEAGTRTHQRDRDAFTAISPPTSRPASAWIDGYPYDENAHQTATGGPSGGLPGGS